jgi:hypothetical protein
MKQKFNPKASNVVNKQKSLLMAGIKRKSIDVKSNAKHPKGAQTEKLHDMAENE